MSRRKNQNAGGIPGVGSIPYVQSMQGGSGGGGSKLPYGTLNIQLGKKGITVAGANIQTVTMPLKAKQQGQSRQQQGQAQGGPWPNAGGGGQGVNPQSALQHCILAATTQSQIAAQQFSLHQQAQAANQQLLTALTAFGSTMGIQPMSKAQRRQYQQPQARVQQTRRKKQNQQQQANQTYQFA